MTNKEIALAVLGKAQEKGFKIPYPFNQQVYWDDIRDDRVPFDLVGLFFSFEFLNAFFDGKFGKHLEEMVMSSNSLEYFKQFINE